MILLHENGKGLQISIKSKRLDAISKFVFDQPKQMTEIGNLSSGHQIMFSQKTENSDYSYVDGHVALELDPTE